MTNFEDLYERLEGFRSHLGRTVYEAEGLRDVIGQMIGEMRRLNRRVEEMNEEQTALSDEYRHCLHLLTEINSIVRDAQPEMADKARLLQLIHKIFDYRYVPLCGTPKVNRMVLKRCLGKLPL